MSFTASQPRLSPRSDDRPISSSSSQIGSNVAVDSLTSGDSTQFWSPRLSRNSRASLSTICTQRSGDVQGTMSHSNLTAFPRSDCGGVGPGASLLPAELSRYQVDSIQRRRRHLALAAGSITLLVVGWTSWSFVEVVASLIDGRNSSQRNSLRYVQLGVSLVTLSVTMAVICWLKHRRINRFSVLCLCAATFTAIFHAGLAVANLSLTLLWRNELAATCSWDVDVAWTLRLDSCPNEDPSRAWAAAAGVRLVMTLLIGLVWLVLLHRYYLTLRLASIADSNAPFSAEAATILQRHSAAFAQLDADYTSLPNGGANTLPHMPDRAAHYAFASGTDSYDETTTAIKPSSLITIVAVKVFSAFAWVLGVPRYSDRNKEDEKCLNVPAEKSISQSLTSQRSASLPGQRWSGIYDILPADQPQHTDAQRCQGSDFNTSPHLSSSRHIRARSINGSSGSTGGHLVFVRMADGQLVRKLSTIASATEAGTDHGRDASAATTTMTALSFATENVVEEEERPDQRGEKEEIIAPGWQQNPARGRPQV